MAATYRLVRGPTTQVGLPLDDAQRQIVEHRIGPLLVTAGPGTGKTSTLVEAVAQRVAEGVDPQRVLVLTFGRRAAAHLRWRISARVGGVTGRASTEPLVRTFHGYAFGLLRRAAAMRGEPPPRLLTGAEQDVIVREMLATEKPEDWPTDLAPALRTWGFAEELRDLLLRAAERGIGPELLSRWGRRHGRPDWIAAARFFREYVDLLALRDAGTRDSAAYDTAELIRAASAGLAADDDWLAAERARAAFVYVDELQDTDPAQVELLTLIAGDGRHLVGFGDPDQSVYGFRGADPGVMADFTDRFRTLSGVPARAITLSTAWRSEAMPLAATRSVAARLRGPAGHRRLFSGSTGDDSTADGEVAVRVFPSVGQQAAYLANHLREAHLRGGLAWSRMAVVVRSASRDLPVVQRALRAVGVPVRAASDDLPLAAQPAVAPFLLLVRCALDPGRLDEAAAVMLLHSALGGADALVERRLRQALRAAALKDGEAPPSAELLVTALQKPSMLDALGDRWAAPARRVAELLQVAASSAVDGATAEDVLWAVWEASGLAQRWSTVSAAGGSRGAGADRDLDAMVALFEVAARFADRLPGAGVAVFVDYLFGQQLPADSLAPSAQVEEAVEVLTAHAAKGREWDLVAIAGVQEGVWPDLRPRGSLLGSELLVDLYAGRDAGVAGVSQVAARLDEERRLFYLAATRARRSLLVCAVASGDGEEQPSRFLEELVPGSLTEPVAPEMFAQRSLTLSALVAELRLAVADQGSNDARQAAARQLARLAAEGVPGADPRQWWGLREISDARPLALPGERVDISPSVVESVTRCGLRWLLERHGGGGRASHEQSVGSLIHAAAAEVSAPDLAALMSYVDDRWPGLEFPARWLGRRRHDQVHAMLTRLSSWLRSNPRTLLAVEESFRVAAPPTFLAAGSPQVRITGSVDRLERDADGRLIVVDLKTGQRIPTDAEVKKYPQLGAYQLAVEWGAFADSAGSTTSGGAGLVQLARDRRAGPEQLQPALSAADEPDWAHKLVAGAAQTMAGAVVPAIANDLCSRCPVRTCCPISEQGRPVTS